MATFKDEDVKGYIIAEQCVCRECVTSEEESKVNQDELILDGQENEHIFCHRCEERIL